MHTHREAYLACKRCRSDASLGSPAWNYRSDAVGRAMRLIAAGVADRDGVPGLGGPAGLQRPAGPTATAGRARSVTWRPWRACAVQHLWATGTHPNNVLPREDQA